MNHEVHKVHEVRQDNVLNSEKNIFLNFVYFVNFVVKKVLV